MVRNMADEAIFLDNNFREKLCKSSDSALLENWHNKFGRKAFVKSPFMLLEALGITATRIPNPKIEFSKTDLRVNLQKVIEYAFAKFSKLDALQSESLKNRAIEQSKYYTTYGQKIFWLTLANVVNQNGFEKMIYENLAFDFAFRFEYPKAIFNRMIGQCITTAFLSRNYEYDFTLSRSLKHTLKPANEIEAPGLERDEVNDMLQDIYSNLSFGSNDDKLDTELPHFAVMGTVANTQKKLLPVTCMTCDERQVVLDRVGMYKTSILKIYQVIEKIKAEDEKLARETVPSYRYGKVLLFNASLELESEIEVGNLT